CKNANAWPSRSQSHEDFKLSEAAFRPGILGFRDALTPSLSGSVKLFRWSHGSSIIVASIRSQKMAPPASNRLLRLKTSSCAWRPALALGGELALALGSRSFAWKQADNSLVSRLCQFFWRIARSPLRLST